MGGAATHYPHTPNTRHRSGLLKDHHFPVGAPVEVCTNEEDWKGVFFTGRVISPAKGIPKRGGRKGSKQICVEYNDLLAHEGGSERLKENVRVASVRPAPPFLEILDPLEPGDFVDAFYNDGWWTGSVKSVLENGRYVVTFKLPPDEREFGRGDLRVHWDWLSGTWIRPTNQSVAGAMFRVGSSVEFSPNEEDNWDAWFPATIVGIGEYGMYSLEYGDANSEIREKTIVDSSCLRPQPPFLKYKNFDLLEKVNAFFDTGWWNGVVTKVLEDGKFLVFLKQRKLDKEFHDSELRPHMEWMDDKWYSQGLQVLFPDDGTTEHGSAENSTVASDIMSANCLDAVKGISFFDRIRSYASAAGPIGSTEEQASTDVTKKSISSTTAINMSGWDASWEMIIKGRQCKIYAAKKIKKSSPCVKKKPLVSQHEVKELILKETSEKDVESTDAAEITETPVIIGLACEEPGSRKTNGGKGISSVVKQDQPMDSKTEKMKAHDEKVERERAFLKRKRGRPRKVKGIQTPGTSDLNMDDRTDTIPAFSSLDQENGDTCQSDADPIKSRVIGVDMEDGEIADSLSDAPLSEWMKAVQFPSKQDVQSTAVSPQQAERDEVATPDITGGHSESEVEINDSAKGSQMLPSEEQSSPFVRSSPLWRTVESMEAFKMMPQRPHFKPLDVMNEGCREGLAIGYMIAFSSVVERASRLQLNDPEDVMDGISETLTDLERFGFDVSMIEKQISKLRELKRELKRMTNEVKELQSQILEDENEATKIDERIEELRGKMSLMAASKEKIRKRLESANSKRKEAQQDMEATMSMFEAIASSSW